MQHCLLRHRLCLATTYGSMLLSDTCRDMMTSKALCAPRIGMCYHVF